LGHLKERLAPQEWIVRECLKKKDDPLRWNILVTALEKGFLKKDLSFDEVGQRIQLLKTSFLF